MKTTKRIFAAVLAVMLLVGMMVVPASADDATYTITINGTAIGHTYEAYQIFTGDLAEGVLSNIGWGAGVNAATLLQALKDSSYFGAKFDACTTAAEVAKVLEDTSWLVGDTDQFAKVVAANLGTVAGTSSASGTTYTISGLEAGYYFVKDTTQAITDDDAYTKYIIHVTDNEAIDVKSALPTLTKEVYSESASSYVEAVSANVGDVVTFRLTATLHGRVSDYETYKLQFVDTLPTGLTEPTVTGVAVSGTTLTDSLLTDNVTTTVSGNTLTVEIADAKALVQAVTGLAAGSSDTVVVTLTAKVSSAIGINAVDGNTNSAVLKYSNNPNNPASLGTTAASTAKVYTYQMTVHKVDAADTAKPLAGAVFTMHRIVGSAKQYVQVDANGFVSGWTTSADQASEMTTNADGKIVIKGLAKGSYHLHEVTSPAGYNAINDEIQVEVAAAFDKNTGTVTGFNATLTGGASVASVKSANTADGNITVQVKNHKGSTLPETGGIGTTIFYVGGILLLAAAVVLLVLKKRAKAQG